MSEHCWWNGVATSTPPLAISRGLHYGDGVFRTMLLHGGQVIDCSAQLDKLLADAAVIGLHVAPASMQSDIDTAIDTGIDTGIDSGDGVLKLLLLRSGQGRGYRPQSDVPDRLLLRYPLPDFPARNRREGIIAIRSPVTLSAQPLLAGIKHLNRLEQVLASRDWPDGIDEAILADDRGAPVCGTRSNLFWVAHGSLHTPALDRCGVAGAMRARLLARAREHGIECRIGTGSWEALLAADEAFISNSLIGIWPLRALGAHAWPAPGRVTADLMRALSHPTLRAS